MSEHFYSYLAHRIDRFLTGVNIKPGEKYHIQFERDEQVLNLEKEIRQLSNNNPFFMTTEDGLYQTHTLNYTQAKVLIASNIDEITPDFLTTLRNKVGIQENPFNDLAMLLIHNSNLDSLVHGMTSFSKQGMPFHIDSIEKDLQEMMNLSNLASEEKLVLNFSIESMKAQQGLHEKVTLFDYENILTILNNEKLEVHEYKDFGLFYDAELFNTPRKAKDIKERLKENHSLFNDVEIAHQYGAADVSLERHFDDHGVKVLSEPETWQNVDFGIVRRSNQKKLEGKGLEYIESSKKLTIEGLEYWERADGETKSKQRKRNIIVFNPEQQEQITLEFTFNDFIKYKHIKENEIKHSIHAEPAGKKLRVHLKHESGQTTFYGIRYKTEVSPAYEFSICVVETSGKLLQSIQTSYAINLSSKSKGSKGPCLLINSEERQWIFNKDAAEILEVSLVEFQNSFEVTQDQELVVSRTDDNNSDEEHIYFNIQFPHTIIPFEVQDLVDRPAPIGGFSVWKLKREKREHFTYRIENNEKMKIIQGTRETFAQGEFKRSLERERKIIETNHMFFKEERGDIAPEPISVSEPLKEAYFDLLRYFRTNDLLPSLAYLDEDYIALAKKYIEVYMYELEQLKNGQSLNQNQRDLVLVGTIQKGHVNPEWLFSPMHPLNLSYQLQLNELVGEEAINDEFLRSMRPTNLLPYVNFSSKLYKAIETADSFEWVSYIDQSLPRFESSKIFVSKLVQEKIEEFTGHFGYLFELDRRAPLKINTINMGDCQEILQGIFEYYKKQLKENWEKSKLLPMDIYIYAEKGINNVFEEMSQYSDAEEIAKCFNLKLELDGYHAEELLNLFRDKVRFYSKSTDFDKYEYSHISFYQMNRIEQVATSNTLEMITGVSLFGLVSGIPSVFINDDYKTGFGTRYYPVKDVSLLKIVPKLNSLLRVARTLDNYQEDINIVTAIAAHHKQQLDQVYDSAHWVTFIEPKVDLSFFKNSDAQKDLLVIHYSDQYTSSSGFDAITVTRRSQQYQRLIKEFLGYQKIYVDEEVLPPVINFFNAINGNWLLRLLAQKNHFPKEKISILSAVKLALAVYSHHDIIWIPISMEEILRISGGTGLRQSEGLFSARKLGRFGSYSDDLLLIGIERQDEEVFVHFYPIEVKIGNNKTRVQDKAKEQVTETKELLMEFLQDEESSFQGVLYRNFFIQLAIASAEKMKIYSVWPEQEWSNVTDHEIRERLLNDEYTIVNTLDQYIGQGAVISFKKDVVFTDISLNDGVMRFEYPEQSGYEFILKGVEEMKTYIQSDQGDLSPEGLLINLYEYSRISSASTTLEKTQTLSGAEDGNLYTTVHGEVAATITTTEDHSVKDKLKQELMALEDIGQAKPLEILFGHNASSNEEVKWFPTSTDKIMHTNTGIIGTMGTGKTQFTKSLITQLSRNSYDNVNHTPISILIFDYKGDYIKPDFTNATNAKVYDLHHLPFNPLSLYITESMKPLLPLHTSSSLTDTILRSFSLGQVQSVTLKDLMMEAYAKKGIMKGDPTTWNLPAPTLSDVYKLYAERENIKIDLLYAALKELYETEVFEMDADKTIPLFEMIDGITVINLSGYNESIQNLVVSITLDVFYNQMQMFGHSAIDGSYREITRMILVDEADSFLSKDFVSIKKILREGREFGVGTILSTQFLSHFSTSDNDYANYILTWIVHNVSEMSGKEIRMVFGTQSKQEEDSIMNRIKSLQKHYSVVKAGSGQPIWMRDKAFWELH